MDFDYYAGEISELLLLLDGDEYPETYDYLGSVMASEDGNGFDPYKVAMQLIHTDKPKIFPEFVIDFITELLKASIEQKNAEAMNDLGAIYYDGDRGFEQSYEKAVYFYNMAAEHGSRQAQENLGYCYYYGRVGEVNYEKAFHYFALGAFDGHLISLYKIGDMYLNGYYVKKNEIEAFNIYAHCMNTMTDEASHDVAGPVYLRLGKMFLNGLGTEKNAETALICYQKAEVFLFQMVKDGNNMYRKSLQAAIDGQAKARQALMGEIS